MVSTIHKNIRLPICGYLQLLILLIFLISNSGNCNPCSKFICPYPGNEQVSVNNDNPTYKCGYLGMDQIILTRSFVPENNSLSIREVNYNNNRRYIEKELLSSDDQLAATCANQPITHIYSQLGKYCILFTKFINTTLEYKWKVRYSTNDTVTFSILDNMPNSGGFVLSSSELDIFNSTVIRHIMYYEGECDDSVIIANSLIGTGVYYRASQIINGEDKNITMNYKYFSRIQLISDKTNMTICEVDTEACAIYYSLITISSALGFVILLLIIITCSIETFLLIIKSTHLNKPNDNSKQQKVNHSQTVSSTDNDIL